MGKIVATYLVKVTAREPDDVEDGEALPDAPTNDALAAAVEAGLEAKVPLLVFRAESERTDI